ncbi:hypothetical protein Syn7803C72_113 [Synechococcus phage ACG-2014d]|jgi:hypothetical protein|uniref:Uncharacterized protein n=1 Tax=Synechococcus phage ACG-2014d TaxID=1493509 RepID=A0A0E3HD90_9CAUD|nr:hypothetical protein AAJ59_gp113 [Synechococcus phage ACG-2014d]YP_010355283.1 hypothetical protein M1M12_gp114 [Synechococcus phage ACG-2014d]AIX14725.1 hypothetical protein Syn7803C45_114 [Synechococcus phage ACG-2014d]AIX14944.1 hypothetical protein Syn7803C46_113 [Synechococcus phage ACG-2014d]AIX15371.1 hypothetical protein Syn7803C48_113 [Synechococcus phage ACG-2014d]AIX15589.1 hypothetical protein Syn7803C49_113 [Synechococcus phage ACG-2014d]AIX16019.1 hypothetical protein Syn7803
MKTRWDFEYYYKGDERKYSGHVYANTQMQACINFQKAYKNAFMIGYPHPTSKSTSGQETIATDSLNM